MPRTPVISEDHFCRTKEIFDEQSPLPWRQAIRDRAEGERGGLVAAHRAPGAEAVSVFRIVFQSIVGLLFAGLAIMALSPLMAGFADGQGAVWLMLLPLAAVTLLVGLAPTLRQAFGRGCLCVGGAIFLLPISTMILSSVVFVETVDVADSADTAVAAAGGALAGGMMTGLAGVVGFFLGGFLLLLGLVLSLGGRREVLVFRG